MLGSRGVKELVKKAIEGDKGAISKIISLVEADPLTYSEVVGYLPAPRDSHIVGVTGSAGVGKSTLIYALIRELVDEGKKVAVLALDPSSPLSGGALLGDRVRFRLTHPNLFLRSMSTGDNVFIPLKTVLTLDLLERLSFDMVFLETPGAGQFSTGVVKLVDTVVVVLMPGAGDEIQALKAGLMEVGDIYVVNKADRPEAELTYSQVLFALKGSVREGGWVPPVIKVSALRGQGVGALLNELLRRWGFLRSRNLVRRKRETIVNEIITQFIDYRVRRELRKLMDSDPEFRELQEKAVKGEVDAVRVANLMLSKLSRYIKPY